MHLSKKEKYALDLCAHEEEISRLKISLRTKDEELQGTKATDTKVLNAS